MMASISMATSITMAEAHHQSLQTIRSNDPFDTRLSSLSEGKNEAERDGLMACTSQLRVWEALDSVTGVWGVSEGY